MDYVVGIARRAVLAKKANPVMELVAMAHKAIGIKSVFEKRRENTPEMAWQAQVTAGSNHLGSRETK